MPDIFQSVSRQQLFIGGTILLSVLLGTLLLVNPNSLTSGLLFAGRLHPVLVHLPIGFLIIAGVLEIMNRTLQSDVLDGGIFVVLALSAVAAVFAAISGSLLSLTGGYNPGHMNWHKWSGIIVAIGSVAATLLKFYSRDALSEASRKCYQAVLLLTIFAVFPAGHFGGTLTHGTGYLTEYLPSPVKALLGRTAEPGNADLQVANIDSAVIFNRFVQPALQQRCVECHGENKSRAQLRLDTPAGILQGGESGAVIQPGQPGESELVRRISMPLQQKGVMPPKEHPPLTIEQIELIRWWIQTGADFEMKVAGTDQEKQPSSIRTVLARLSQPGSESGGRSILLEVAEPDTAAVSRARAAGASVEYISQSEPFLQVNFQSAGDSLSGEIFESLLPLSEQIIWMDCSGKYLTDSAVSAFAEFGHLMNLHLELTNISDDGLSHLSNLSHLTYLNLYGTQISNQGLAHLSELQNLENLYLWQTDVTETGAENLRKTLKNVTVNTGDNLVSIQSDSA